MLPPIPELVRLPHYHHSLGVVTHVLIIPGVQIPLLRLLGTLQQVFAKICDG
jgi:hypothetical protein